MEHNIFVEGLQGTGKTTLLDRLSKAFPKYHVYKEGDVSPVELAWCSYATKGQYEDVCKQEILEDNCLVLPSKQYNIKDVTNWLTSSN